MTEALLLIGVILSALAVALCIVIIYRSGRSYSGHSANFGPAPSGYRGGNRQI